MEIKKGIEPKKEDNTQTQYHINRLLNVCLAVSLIGCITTLAGKYSNNSILFGLGLGLMCSTAIIGAIAVLEEDKQ